MTYAQAQNILDERRAGADFPLRIIDKALTITGDKRSDAFVSALLASLGCVS